MNRLGENDQSKFTELFPFRTPPCQDTSTGKERGNKSGAGLWRGHSRHHVAITMPNH
jgi:hypothetical protein